MTVRVRRPKGGIRTRLGRLVEGEERQNLLVTWGFIAAIAAVLLILVGAIGLSWYNDNLRALARVGGAEVGPQLLRDSVALQQWRIAREESRVTQAQIDGEIDAETAQARIAELNQRAEDLPTTALEDLIDGIFQSQLAAQEGITVADTDIDQALADEVAGVERRHVQLIAVEPEAADAESGPNNAERAAALERAEEALAEVTGGADWATVAREYSTDDSAPNGGDLGLRTQATIEDAELSRQLFELEQGGTTGIIRGDDGIYRLGRVTEIQTAGEEPGQRDELFASVSEQSVRQILGYQVAADRLRAKITDAALAETPEQARLAVIYVAGLFSGDPEDQEGEVDYSEIVFAPNDDLTTAPDLAEDDPAWEEAKTAADNAFAQLSEVPDPETMKTLFEQLAIEGSDAPSGEEGGRQGFVTRSIPPVAVGDALFDGTHTENELIGPIRGDAGWYVLLFHERRDTPEARVQAVQDALAEPGADFAEVARELSEGPEAEEGGDVGWLSRDQLAEELVEQVFGLDAGEVSEPIELGEGHYFIKVLEKAVRALDPDQIPSIRATAFDNWYSPKKEEAETNGVIVRADEAPVDEGDFLTGEE